ncbi:MAG: response regulator [Nitrospirales bacterium]|nr:response regulator [Nitrospirales bacterium]
MDKSWESKIKSPDLPKAKPQIGITEAWQFRDIIDKNSDGVLILNDDKKILYSNSAAQQMFQRSETELYGAPFGFSTSSNRPYEIDLIGTSDQPLPVELRVLNMAGDRQTWFLVFLRDISDRRKAEEDHRRHEQERQYAQKLESLGVLAGGIAHDFNNLLMTVVARAGLALRTLPPDSPAREHLQCIERSGIRGGELANQMLTFAGKTKLEFQSLSFTTLIKEMKSFIRSSISKRLTLKIESDESVPFIRGDRAQLRQMVMNITLNAAEAIGEHEGTITLRLKTIDSSKEDFRPFHIIGDLPWGPCVSLKIIDTGCGIKTELIPKIFDPFFTTKLPGRGLGLAALLGIIRAHSAALAVQSQEGQGSEFWLLFPISHKPVKPGPTRVIIPDAKPTSSSQSMKVLVVDDEEDVREACSLILREIGMEPLVANDGYSGMSLFTQHQNQIALILLDLTMPNMDGGLLCKKIRHLSPSVPILISSGYAEIETMKHFNNLGVNAFIQKPFQVEDLIEKVQQVLGIASAPSLDHT